MSIGSYCQAGRRCCPAAARLHSHTRQGPGSWSSKGRPQLTWAGESRRLGLRSCSVFDHAMIMFRLPRTAAGLGIAGACRPLYRTGLLRRCRVYLKKMRDPTKLSEWRRLLVLDISLSQPEDESVEPPDPFVALKHAETIADNIAFSLVPRRVLRPGAVRLFRSNLRQCFGFGGHRVIFREFNLLRAARQLVKMVLLRSAEITQCPQRLTRWHFSFSKLPNHLRKSKLYCPLCLKACAILRLSATCPLSIIYAFIGNQ